MDWHWISPALGDVGWIALAFVLGLAARLVNLPPLVGFLIAGFLLNALGVTGGDTLEKISEIGVTLLLFTCLLYTSPSPRDKRQSRMPSSA